jgi:trypsin-like peptidase
VRVGNFALAIGYPANIGPSVTSGIVSGLHGSNIGIKEFENFIQTDAAIYPGNSGGTRFIGATSSNPGTGSSIRSWKRAKSAAAPSASPSMMRCPTWSANSRSPPPAAGRDHQGRSEVVGSPRRLETR